MGWLRHDVPVGHVDFGQLFPCGCLQKEFDLGRCHRLTLYSNLGALVGVTFNKLSLEARGENGAPGPRPDMAHAIEVARTYAQEPKGWLVITGPAGSGKTRIAAAIANQRIDLGHTALFIPVADLLDHLRSTFSPSSDIAYDELFEQVREVPLLILDDLGQESATPWAREKLAQLLGHRYNGGLPTVITTDSPIVELESRIRARIADATMTQTLTLRGPAGAISTPVDRLDLVLPHMTFDTFKIGGQGLRGAIQNNLKEACVLAKSFASDPDGWLIYFGSHGCGKTHLASAIAHQCRARGDDVLMILVPQFLDLLRGSFGQEGHYTYDAIDRVERAGLLVLDDFSESIGTPWTRERLDVILNYRYLNRLPTVITSSLSPDEMEPRFWSRMSDLRLSNIYEILAPDYRTGRDYPERKPADTGRGRGRPRGRTS